MHRCDRLKVAALLIISANILGCESVDNNRPPAAPLTPLQACFADVKSRQIPCTLGAFSAAENFGGPISQQRLRACDQLRIQEETHCMRMEQFRRETSATPVVPPNALGSNSVPSARSASPAEVAFELRNVGKIPIVAVFAVPAFQRDWGNDLLRGQTKIPAGGRHWVRPDIQYGCEYTIWITYAEGRGFGIEKQNLCLVRQLNFGKDS